MLQRLDILDAGEVEAADSNPADAPETPPKRGRGRPPGSRGKLARESREVVAKFAPRVWERIGRQALGLPVFTEPDETGRRAKRYPSEEAELSCQKMIADRSIASLKAVETSGPDGNAPLIVRISDSDAGLLAGFTPDQKRSRCLDRNGLPPDSPDFAHNSWASDAPGSPPAVALDEGAGEEAGMTFASASSPFEPSPKPDVVGKRIQVGPWGDEVMLESIDSSGTETWVIFNDRDELQRRMKSRVDAIYWVEQLIERRGGKGTPRSLI